MGVALVPRSIVGIYSERARLSLHPLPAKSGRMVTRLIWRKDAAEANILALSRVLLKGKTGPSAGRS
ncbi:hypothetical protein OJJOAM_004640 [Cupriavidus sp. H18C1]